MIWDRTNFLPLGKVVTYNHGIPGKIYHCLQQLYQTKLNIILSHLSLLLVFVPLFQHIFLRSDYTSLYCGKDEANKIVYVICQLFVICPYTLYCYSEEVSNV